MRKIYSIAIITRNIIGAILPKTKQINDTSKAFASNSPLWESFRFSNPLGRSWIRGESEPSLFAQLTWSKEEEAPSHVARRISYDVALAGLRPNLSSQSWKPYLDIRTVSNLSSPSTWSYGTIMDEGLPIFIPRTNVWKTVAFNRNRLIPSPKVSQGWTADGLISIRQSKKSVVIFDRKLISFLQRIRVPDLDNSGGNEIGCRSNWNFWIKGNEVAMDHLRFSSPPFARCSFDC